MPERAKAEAIADIARWVAETRPIFAIAKRYPLDRIVEAHLAVERAEKLGHVILTIA
jgi:NADPH:quinone reductase-like Zn-dependent oxidoreductase